MKASAVAFANIALCKYWGNRDEALVLPNNGSISMTCEGLKTVTSVAFSEKYKDDIITLNDNQLSEGKERIIAHLNLIRRKAGINQRAKVVSQNSFPIATGLASSASGFAALSVAGSEAAGLALDRRELSILARRGSGSACRSISGGFVEWKKGELSDGSDSFATEVAPKDHWPEFRMFVVVVTETRKMVSSRVRMAQTVESCPFYRNWLQTVDEELKVIRRGILERNFQKVAETAEFNSLKMHAMIIATKPPLVYWNAKTMQLIQSVLLWRREGLQCYFNIDAGPNVAIMVLRKDEEELKRRLHGLIGIKRIIKCKAGNGAHLVNEHLF
jgi:diphosphomevalonate decarboxylase